MNNQNDNVEVLAKAIAKAMAQFELDNNKFPFDEGQQVLIRTMTFYTVGKIVSEGGKFLILNEASFIAGTGKWDKMIESGLHRSESEVYHYKGPVVINKDSIVDAHEYLHELPINVKKK